MTATDRSRSVWVVDPSLFTFPYDHELCRALTETGHRVRLFARRLRPGESPPSPPAYEMVPAFYPMTEGRDSGRLRGLPRTILKGLEHGLGLRQLVAKARLERPDIVQLQWLPIPWIDRFALAAMARRVPLMLTVHDATAGSGRGFSWMQRRGYRAALRHFERLIVHDETGRRALIDAGIDRESVVVLPHPPLPLPGAAPPPDPNRPVVMLFGEIKPYKGVDVAIRAMAQLPPDLQARLQLVVAGRPRMSLVNLKRLASDLGVADRVEWIDRYVPSEELPSLLGRATAFILPYREADASGVLSLVLQLGRPIIASRTGVFPEMVGTAGCGEIVEPGDPRSLAEAVARVFADPALAKRLGGRARASARSAFSWNDMAERLSDLYEDARSSR